MSRISGRSKPIKRDLLANASIASGICTRRWSTVATSQTFKFVVTNGCPK